jgi:hypothetical protein
MIRAHLRKLTIQFESGCANAADHFVYFIEAAPVAKDAEHMPGNHF